MAKTARREMKTHEAVPAVQENTAVQEAGEVNYFSLYGQQASQRPIIGKLLRFNKGDWLAGADDEEIEEGTRLVFHMNSLSVGWVKWSGQKPERQLLGLVIEGYVPQKRQELGDLDEKLWEVDDTGKARDPWTLTNQVVAHLESEPEELFTFSAQSKGSINAVGELCKQYGEEMRLRPGKLPVVSIGSSSYNHSNKAFGRIKIPTFKIVDWA